MQLVVLFVSFFVCVYMCWSSWLIWCERCMCLSHSRSHTPRERDTNALSRWSGAVHMCRGILNLFSNKTLLYITFCFFCCYTAGSCSPSPSPFFYLFFSTFFLHWHIGYKMYQTNEWRWNTERRKKVLWLQATTTPTETSTEKSALTIQRTEKIKGVELTRRSTNNNKHIHQLDNINMQRL